jgi:hypothetical protein
MSLPPLNKQEVHRHIRQNDENATVDRQSNCIGGQIADVKAETGQDCGARDFDVETVLLVDEAQD